eukprot:CAMPEP_0184646618 /NCGR_PEP_ID=MMETSP0308-20130426/3352_1 /TAXON_ID=38269 /ORGANISM="Gloeochaete witrockiana, Strain SAG 46.84" /LENGTH=89 /DNA_ID=CAMNT_0027076805 /DNA_START=1487 /DNA_END=1756 /DNA_ORIENTATION=+
MGDACSEDRSGNTSHRKKTSAAFEPVKKIQSYTLISAIPASREANDDDGEASGAETSITVASLVADGAADLFAAAVDLPSNVTSDASES